jgi:hypothetical protein
MRRSTGSARLADGFQDACAVLGTRFLKALPADCRSSRVRDDAPAADWVLFTAGLLPDLVSFAAVCARDFTD